MTESTHTPKDKEIEVVHVKTRVAKLPADPDVANNHAMLVAIEGIDGTGKATQTRMLRQALQAEGYTVAVLSFPCYGQTLGALAVSKYLHSYDPDAISPELAALAYAADRAETRDTLMALLHNPEIDFVICDRYVGSNMAHQSARLPDQGEAATLRDAIYAFEHNVNGMPLPDVQILLDLPVDEAMARLQAKREELDNHEVDATYLRDTRDAYLNMLQDDRSIKLIGCHVSQEAITEADEERIISEYGDAVDEDVEDNAPVTYAQPRTTMMRILRTVLDAYDQRQQRANDRIVFDMVLTVEEKDPKTGTCQKNVESDKGNCCDSGTPSCKKTTEVCEEAPPTVEEASRSVIEEAEPQPVG